MIIKNITSLTGLQILGVYRLQVAVTNGWGLAESSGF
jgi:hypothetical protein